MYEKLLMSGAFAACLAIGACGGTTEQRAASGGLGGAAAGAMVGGPVGAVIGGAAGAGTGAVMDESVVDKAEEALEEDDEAAQ